MTLQTATPMLRQYHKIKAKHPDCILFFRLGDFYEMFYEDAQIASQILDLVLTARGKGNANPAPMCGIPHHASEGYIARLVKAGKKVAICEQLEDPALAKGIVQRDVIRIITTGTYLDEASSDSRFLICIFPNGKSFGLAFMDPTSGTIQTSQSNSPQKIMELMTRLPIHECIYPASEEERINKIFRHPLLRVRQVSLSPHEDWCFNTDIAKKNLCEHFGVHNLRGFGVEELPLAVASCGALLEYLKLMNKQPLRHIDKIKLYSDEKFVFISPAATRGLELEYLFSNINHALTAMGKRNLRQWLYHPLRDPNQIILRQDAITILKNSQNTLKALKDLLKQIPDFEKSLSKLSCGYRSPRDLLAIRNSLCLLPLIKSTLAPIENNNAYFLVQDAPSLKQLLKKSINENIPLSNSEGKIIKEGFNQELDHLRSIQGEGHQWLKNFQTQEIRRTGINSLKVGYNRVFGYYIEVTKTQQKNVPADYIRKQTLVNAERFITPELKEYEEKILTAQDKIIKLENTLLDQIQKEILDHASEIHSFAKFIAECDSIYALTILALKPNYIAPKISEDTRIVIQDGRHPVVESSLCESFVPNDSILDCDENHCLILTGPNMAGKSTYIRQTALLVILAQMGSYLPAKKAEIGVVEKIFTRIGAHDDITKGQSTFMVEMNEMADILNNLTDRSLVILDEIGRGTSTYDGLSLAWALAEFFARAKSRTLFATHFHELTALAEEFPGVKNYNVTVKEWKDEIIFLHKIIPGGTDDSYGIYVAKLAGIPQPIIKRSRQILTQLELKKDIKTSLSNSKLQETQLNFFNQPSDDTTWQEIKAVLNALDINQLKPLDALNKIHELKNIIENDT